MTNLEKYFGIKVLIREELDPFRITLLQEKAQAIAEIVGFDINDFYVYVHSLAIIDKPRQFHEEIEIQNRIKSLDVSFKVNPKQTRSKSIKFYNELVDLELPKGVREALHSTEVLRMYPGSLLKKGNTLKTELITYLGKDLRKKRFRKIKINLEAFATKSYHEVLTRTNKERYLTQVDLRFDRSITMNMPNLTVQEQRDTTHRLKKILSPSLDEQPFLTINNNNMAKKIEIEKSQIQQVGENNTAIGNTFQQVNQGDSQPVNFELLSKQLEVLKMKVESEATTEEERDAIGYIEEAKAAADDKDEKTMMKKLKDAGGVALNAARDIAVDITAEVIKKSMEL